ncbi:hypothetical protein HF521_002059 [Silurus meridionalis]|uniref:V-SNARE coiled-coil homology domain-containing protein n=1 Tax=Silurus meridionalis TaxID=175797 RepID=A0A8T0B3G7_SILME|nr:hypothetical protein HF521_002059 [Silurus meridionalis]
MYLTDVFHNCRRNKPINHNCVFNHGASKAPPVVLLLHGGCNQMAGANTSPAQDGRAPASSELNELRLCTTRLPQNPNHILSAPAPAGAPAPEGGNQAPPNLTSNRRLQQTQAQVDEVVDIMRVNVDKVLERDQKLSELDDRADALQAGASQFETSAAKLKNKYWWKNAKMMIILGVICVIVLIVIIVYFST